MKWSINGSLRVVKLGLVAAMLIAAPFTAEAKTVPVTINSVTIIGGTQTTLTAVGTGFFACNPGVPSAVFNGTALTWLSSDPTSSSMTYILPLSLMKAGGTYSLTLTNCTGGSATFNIGYSAADPTIAHTNAANSFAADQTVQGNLTANGIYADYVESFGGVLGVSSSTATFSSGVTGHSTATSGLTIGVLGQSESSSDASAGIVGTAASPTGTTHGIRAIVESGQGTAGFFMARSTGNVLDGFSYTGPSSNPSLTEAFRVNGVGAVYATSYNSLSDRNAKENVQPVDGAQLLVTLASLPVLTWNYKAQPASVRHIGPMAQDFRAAFGFGEDDKHIATIDSEGVALVAIQELYRLNLEKDAQLKRLSSEVGELRELRNEVNTLRSQLEQITRQRSGSKEVISQSRSNRTAGPPAHSKTIREQDGTHAEIARTDSRKGL